MLNRVEGAEQHAVSADEFRWLHDRGRPPRQSRVWAGAWSGRDSEWYLSILSAQGLTRDGAPDALNTYVFLFAVGAVVFCVWGTSTRHLPQFELTGPLSLRMRSIWPTAPGQTFGWPPGPAVDDALMDEVRRVIPNVMPQVARAADERLRRRGR